MMYTYMYISARQVGRLSYASAPHIHTSCKCIRIHMYSPARQVGRLSYASAPLRLGDLVGNVFALLLRGLRPVPSTDGDAVKRKSRSKP